MRSVLGLSTHNQEQQRHELNKYLLIACMHGKDQHNFVPLELESFNENPLNDE